MASPYNCDNTGTLNCAAKLEDLKAYLSNVGEVFFPEGTYLISDDLSIPAGIIIRGPKAVINIASGKTLTLNGPTFDDVPSFIIADTASLVINGAFSPGLRKIFTDGNISYDGVAFGVGAVKEVYPEWWATNTTPGTTDMHGALQSAINSISLVGGELKLSNTTYLNTASLEVGRSINIIGVDHWKSIIKWTGSGACIKGTSTWSAQRFDSFYLDMSSNANIGAIGIDADKGSRSCYYGPIIYHGTQTGCGPALYLRGESSGGVANNSCYFNKIQTWIYGGGAITGPAVIIGKDESNCRGNDNIVGRYFSVSGYSIGVQVSGQNNLFQGANFQENTDCGVYFLADNSTGVSGVYSNLIIGCYFDGYPGGAYPIKVLNSCSGAGDDIHVFTLVGPSVGISPGDTASDISITNSGTGTSFYSYIDRSICLGGIIDGTLGTRTGSPNIHNLQHDGFLQLWGGPKGSTVAENGAAIYLCGKDVANGAESIGPGKTVIILNSNLAESCFVVSKTTDYINHTRLFQILNSGAIRGLRTSNGPVGTLTLNNTGATETVVNNTSVTADSLIYMFPTSANAATAVATPPGVYNSSISAGVSFTVTHPASPGAGATMNYIILN